MQAGRFVIALSLASMGDQMQMDAGLVSNGLQVIHQLLLPVVVVRANATLHQRIDQNMIHRVLINGVANHADYGIRVETTLMVKQPQPVMACPFKEATPERFWRVCIGCGLTNLAGQDAFWPKLR